MDWKRKLTSRKFWLSVVNFVTLIIIAMGYNQGQADRIAAIIMAGASVVAYIIGEGLADCSNAGYLIEEDEDATEENSDN